MTSSHGLNQLSEEEKQSFGEYVQSIVHKQVNQKPQVLMKRLQRSKPSSEFLQNPD